MTKSILCAFTLAGLLAAPAARAELPVPSSDRIVPPSITVSGTARAHAKPDLAHVEVGVSTDGPTAAAALAANNAAMNGLMSTLKAQGIEDRDIQTSGFNIEPQYRPTDSSNYRRPQIVGYRVNNQVHVRVRHMNQLGPLLDTLVKSGANNVGGISFTIDEPEHILDTIRAAAVEDAHRKALLYAEGAHVKLGRVLYVNEGGGMPVPFPQPRMMAMAASAESVPIATGENELAVSVTVVYAIE
jgi:hypothetical protein